MNKKRLVTYRTHADHLYNNNNNNNNNNYNNYNNNNNDKDNLHHKSNVLSVWLPSCLFICLSLWLSPRLLKPSWRQIPEVLSVDWRCPVIITTKTILTQTLVTSYSAGTSVIYKCRGKKKCVCNMTFMN